MYRGKQYNTPLKSCKEYCKECMNAELFMGDIGSCSTTRCSIYPYRFGTVVRGKYPTRPVLCAIRSHCLDCVGSYQEIQDCSCNGSSESNNLKNYKCPLYEFRLGTNPYSKRKGSTPAQMIIMREHIS